MGQRGCGKGEVMAYRVYFDEAKQAGTTGQIPPSERYVSERLGNIDTPREDIPIGPPKPSGEISERMIEQEKLLSILGETIEKLEMRLQIVVASRPRGEAAKDNPQNAGSKLGAGLQRHNEVLAWMTVRLRELTEDIVL